MEAKLGAKFLSLLIAKLAGQQSFDVRHRWQWAVADVAGRPNYIVFASLYITGLANMRILLSSRQ
jgi:hypothetical protein